MVPFVCLFVCLFLRVFTKFVGFSLELSMGPGTHVIPVDLFEQNRKRLADRLRAREGLGNAIVLLQGGSEIPFYDTDTTYIFRQVYGHIFYNKKRHVRRWSVFNIFAAPSGSTDGQ